MDTTQLRITSQPGKLFLILLLCLIAPSGCCHHRDKRSWCPPNLATPWSTSELADVAMTYPVSWKSIPADALVPRPGHFLAAAEANYAIACEQEADGLDSCLDSYFTTVKFSWPLVEDYLSSGQSSPASERAWQLYHSAVAQLIAVGPTMGRFDPSRGLIVTTDRGKCRIDSQHCGFVWNPQDFARLVLVGDYWVPELTSAFRNDGLGVPLVVESSTERTRRWVNAGQLFNATALLRPVSSGQGVGWSFEFHNPMNSQDPLGDTSSVPLASDQTAALAYRLRESDRAYLTDFLQPGATTANIGLYMIEPYQPGKIPLLFVHGLLSDPRTWADMANQLRAHPDVTKRYQLWAFQYATGEDFLASAAKLRRQLSEIRTDLDPQHRDRALDRMVVVGHSMGGLLSKLQVTTSGDRMWRSIADQPVETIRMDPETSRKLRYAFFFSPVPSISRVIFIGTPHRGSPWANRCIGRIGAALASRPEQVSERFGRLIDENPDAFAPEVANRLPGSIDLLRPENRQLMALWELPVSPHVTLHSIIGTGYVMRDAGPSDSVVPVSSARHPGVASELMVKARHEDLHRSAASVADILRILRQHATMVSQLK